MNLIHASQNAYLQALNLSRKFFLFQHLNRDYILGLILLGIVVILWTLSSFITQALFQDGYQKPFLLTYLTTGSFTFYLLPFLWRRHQGKAHSHKQAKRHSSDPSTQPLLIETQEPPSSLARENDNLPPLTFRETSDLALAFCFLWFVANWTVNASLFYTSVASSTILASTSGLFTLVIGRIFMVEKLTNTKISAVILSFLGIVLVSTSDSSDSNTPTFSLSHHIPFASGLIGDFLALLSALFYALYAILLKVRIRSESRIDTLLFFGFVGLYNILFCWIIGLVLHVTGVELFELPHTSSAVQSILFNMFVTFTSDYLYLIAMLKTTPLVVTVGLSLTIPLAVIGDAILGKPTYAQVLFGAALVLVSFFTIGLADGGNHSGGRAD